MKLDRRIKPEQPPRARDASGFSRRPPWRNWPDEPDEFDGIDLPGISRELRAIAIGALAGAAAVLAIWLCQVEYARYTTPAPHAVMVGVDG